MYEHADEERQIHQTGASKALMQVDPKISKATLKVASAHALSAVNQGCSYTAHDMMIVSV